jgi:hypothetical protein
LPWIFIPRHVSHIFSLQTVTTFPSVRSSSPTYSTSTFISNSADGLVSGELLCDTFRLVWCVCLRPSLYLPQWFLDITWERISNIVGNLEWELLKYVEIRKSIYARITNTRFENSAYIKKNHIFSLLFNKIMFIWYEIGYL